MIAASARDGEHVESCSNTAVTWMGFTIVIQDFMYIELFLVRSVSCADLQASILSAPVTLFSM
jgi:hypothetical protein